ncbi:MAG: hypothetical protein GXY36_09055 [Chloroflexi bacterium]|nr:hypothetical protein [Chloroflexota bacterium]
MKKQFMFALLGTLCLVLLGSRASAAPPGQQPDRLVYGDERQGHLSLAHPQDEWHFSGRAGDLILIDMQAASPEPFDTYLTLAQVGGDVLASDDDGGSGLNARLGPYRLPHDGDYRITASSYSGAGRYTLTLVRLNDAPRLTPDQPMRGRVNSAHRHDFYLWRSDAPDGRLHRLSAMPTGSALDSPTLDIYGPDGYIAGAGSQAGGVLDPIITMPGELYLIVVGWDPLGPGGPYELRLEESAVALLEDGLTQIGRLDANQIAQRHLFQANAGETVRLTIAVTRGDLTPVLTVRHTVSDQALFTSQSQSVTTLSVTLVIPESGLYAADIRDDAGLHAGAYTITFHRMQPAGQKQALRLSQ